MPESSTASHFCVSREAHPTERYLAPDAPLKVCTLGATLAPVNIPHDNLPVQLSSFIGRERERAEVKQLLAAARLVTLTGAGGCGKTSLGLRAARDLSETYPDGVAWVELAPLADTVLLPQAVVKALGITEQPHRSLTDTLVDFLRDKRLLLVLDNCEHLIDACAVFVTLLLRHCPDLAVLATSREALNIEGEQIWIVPSLELPSRNTPLSLDTLQRYDAVELFVERAAAVSPGFKLIDQNAPAVVHICRQLDGIPLAIELAAARVKVLSVEEIAARLDDALGLLTQGKRTAPPRHQTLRATIDWSYNLLPRETQKLLRRLSIFASGFTLPAAEVVCVDDTLLPDSVLGELSRLVDRSLVSRDPEAGDERYRMLETIRQYGHEKLVESGELDILKDRHRDYFLRLAEKPRPEAETEETLRWFDELERENDNLRAALAWSQANENSAETALRLAAALATFWSRRGYFSSGRSWLDGALKLADRATRRAEADVRPGEDAHHIPSVSFLTAKAWALEGAGNLARAQGDFRSAKLLQKESVLLFRELDDKVGLATALDELGLVTLNLGDRHGARSLLEASLTLSQETGNQPGIANALLWLGHVARAEGDDAAARTLYERSIIIYRAIGNRGGVIAWPLYQLGALMASQGDYGGAVSLYQESLSILREWRDKRGIGEVLAALGDARRWQGDQASARACYEEGLELSREAGIHWVAVWCLSGLGNVALRERDYSRAVALFREGLAFHLLEGRRDNTAKCLAGMAAVLAIQNESSYMIEAARLLGAIKALDVFVAEYDQDLTVARDRLDPKVFEQAFGEGSALTLEEAIAEAERMSFQPDRAPTAPHEMNALTPRETQVLRLLAQGLSDAQIAEQLVISRRTVNTHLAAIYGKLGVNSRSATTRYALDHHLV